jgi:hypothetical protein
VRPSCPVPRPTAWQACGEEQLLREATLDAAATMLTTCPTPHLPLITSALTLVAHATSQAADPDGGPPLEPPVGLVEIAMRLWRHAVSSIRPPLADELAPQLGALAVRLPALIALGDELVRPAMMLLDWLLLADATHREPSPESQP